MARYIVRLYLPEAGPITEADFVACATGDRVQICNVVIECEGQQLALRLHLARTPHRPTRMDALPPSAPDVAVLVHDRDDEIHAITEPSQAHHANEVAAAISVMKAAWAWDEREEFRVRVNTVVRIAVPRHDRDRHWNVEVRDAAV